ncbi:MAG TPA: type II toxin-antitoxin system RelE/ParE family toxin [Chloroflexota bacterium]|nr:type II toxin-antitoxin system RelE/ParE family toxin [Chloroflexota bacterium]HUM68693.1 type II toxin-antitoxin system RelE/ParE family toxin [Chloroflexota bacterium]
MADTEKVKTVIAYRNDAGQEPFTDWLNRLRDPSTRRRILKRLLRVESGNYGDFKPVGEGVNELRLFFGAGYRIYFGEDGDKIVVLLTGGDKGSQRRDIQQAQAYWKEYLSHV